MPSAARSACSRTGCCWPRLPVTLSLLSFLLAFGMAVLIVRARRPVPRWCSPQRLLRHLHPRRSRQESVQRRRIALERVLYFSLAGLFVRGRHAPGLGRWLDEATTAGPQPA
jgi:hypothetical protein